MSRAILNSRFLGISSTSFRKILVVKHALFLLRFFVLFLVGNFSLRAESPVVTVTKRAPLEALGTDGSIIGVSMAIPGMHYTVIKYIPAGIRGVPAVIVADDQNHEYRLAVSAIDHTPPPAPSSNVESSVNPPGTGAPTAAKVRALAFAELPPSVQKKVQSYLNGRSVGKVERIDDQGEICYEIETKTPDGSLGLTVAQDGTLMSDETVFTAVPASVQTAITTAVGKGKLNGIAKTFEDGEITYVAGITSNGYEREFTFGENGTLLKSDIEMTDLAPVVQAAMKAAVGQASIGKIEKSYNDGVVTYVAEISANHLKHEGTFREDGTLLNVEMDYRSLPPAVQTAIKTAVGQGRLGKIEKTYDEGEITYVAEIGGTGLMHEFTFQEGGTLVSQEVTLAELTPALQTAIVGNQDGGRLKGIEKTTQDGTTVYIVSVSKNYQDRNLTFGEDGTLLAREVRFEEVPSAVQATIASTLGSGQVTGIDLAFEDGKHVYEVEGKKDGQKISFAVNPKGKFLGMGD